jgi:hypothetical protein
MSKQKKSIREKFRNDVFERDHHRCVMCGRSDCKLDAHHISDRHTIPNGGYVKENGITLCDVPGGCHEKAEQFHISGGKEWVAGYHPNDIYAKIGSSYARAHAAALREG